MPGPWQLRFDDGHQQRYLPDRQAVLRYVLAIGPKAGSRRFEVFAESAPVRLADGTPGGRTYALAEVIDLSRPGETERLRAELGRLAGEEPAGTHQGPPLGAASGTGGTGAAPSPGERHERS
jgi:hypothetical protein